MPSIHKYRHAKKVILFDAIHHDLRHQLTTISDGNCTCGFAQHRARSETNLRLRYRRSTPWDWAFVELRPAVAFPRDKDYDATWRFMLRFEGIFGYKPKYETLEFGPEKNLDYAK